MKKAATLFVSILFSTCLFAVQPVQCSGERFQEGLSLLKAKRYDEAIHVLSRDISEAYNNRGYAWHLKGDYQRAVVDFTKALDITPDYADAHNNRGLALYQMGEYDRAMSDYNKAIEINPRLAEAYYNRAASWLNKGQYDQAVADYTKAIEINPRFGEAYYNRGIAWTKKGKYDFAIADCSKALDISPTHADAYNQLAWILSACPDERYRNGKKAVDFSKKAVEIEEKPAFLDTLAAAYAESGKFNDAIKAQERAMALFQGSEDDALLSQYRTRLETYKARKPWRDPRMKKEEDLQYAEKSVASMDSSEAGDDTQKTDIAPSATPDSSSPKVFSVQAGAFLSSKNAEKLLVLLNGKGYSARLFIMPDSRGRVWHYILIGKYATRDLADEAAKAFSDREKMASTVLELEPF
jgi:tetratricopeptide (TPR) repeat protein